MTWRDRDYPRGTVDKTGAATRRRAKVELLRRHGRRCHLCRRMINLALRYPHPFSFSRDHVIPRSLGGDVSAIENQRPSHKACNQLRGNRPAGWQPRGGWPPMRIRRRSLVAC